MKRNNYYTLFGLNNTISVLEANECLEINVDIVEGSRFEKDTKLIKLLKQRQISSSLLEKKVFNKKFSEKRNQGVSVSFYYDLVKTKTPNYFNKENSCYLILDQINDPQNFGQIIRTAECSGVDGIIYSKHNSVPVTNSVLQVSQGAFFNMSVFEVTNIKNENISENKLDMHEIVTLASIIQWEAMYDDEMKLISSVYHNRLNKNMLLQADPTIQYILPERKKRLLKKHTRI